MLYFIIFYFNLLVSGVLLSRKKELTTRAAVLAFSSSRIVLFAVPLLRFSTLSPSLAPDETAPPVSSPSLVAFSGAAVAAVWIERPDR